MSYELQTDANDLIQSHFTVFIRRTFVSCLMSCDILDAFVHREKMVCQMAEMGHERLGGASCRSQQCPKCPVSDGRPEKGGLSLRANNRLTQRSK
jgi:hypothetical protein